MDKQFAVLTWHDFVRAVDLMAVGINKIKEEHIKSGDDKQLVLYGPPRGGYCLSVALSHATDLPITTMPHNPAALSVIWVDDIIDSGTTLSNYCSISRPRAAFTWVGSSKGRSFLPTKVTSVLEIDINTWYVFPWEQFDKAKADYENYRLSRGGALA